MLLTSRLQFRLQSQTIDQQVFFLLFIFMTDSRVSSWDTASAWSCFQSVYMEEARGGTQLLQEVWADNIVTIFMANSRKSPLLFRYLGL